MKIEPVTLFGKTIRLDPLQLSHVPDLTIAGKDESIWRYMLYGTIRTEQQMRVWVEDMLARQAKGTDLPFAIILLAVGKAIGATRFMEIRPEHRGVEIGGTWIQPEYQRSSVNSESKYLLLKHAFENWGCIRVQFKTDVRNVVSQQAIERLGAMKEGIFRNHLITPEGILRDSVYYSIINTEWPAVKAKLERRLAR